MPDHNEKEGAVHFAVAVVACSALLPFLLNLRQFRKLFWFGDEWDLISLMDKLGFWVWTTKVFAENFVPLFKIIWGGSILTFNGSYLWMIALVWLNHVINVYLLGKILCRIGLRLYTIIIAQFVFALSSTNVETFGWSVQWSSVMATTFFLWSIYLYLEILSQSSRAGFVAWTVYPIMVLFSALSFSRGILTGLILAFISILPPATRIEKWSSRLSLALVSAAPSFLVALVIYMNASGNHRHIGENFAELARLGSAFAVHFFTLNPLLRMVGGDTVSLPMVLLLGLVKVLLFLYGLLKASERMRPFFWALVVFDVSNAVLMGLGRYHTGLSASISSRYQYQPLLCLAPILGLWVENTARAIFGAWRWYLTIAVGAMVALVAVLLWPWPSVMQSWSGWRGSEPRYRLLEDPTPPAVGTVPGIPHFPTDRAKELINKYGLH